MKFKEYPGVVADTHMCVSRTVFQKGVVILLFQDVCNYGVTFLRTGFKIILNIT